VKMIEGITAVMEVALLAAFVLVLGGFAVLLWDLLRERMRGWLRVMVVVVGAPAGALAVTVISVAAGFALASALGPDEPPAQRTEPAKEDLDRTSTERRGSETTAERRGTPSATPSASPPASPTPPATASPTASPAATPSPSASPSP
jgi:type IV secretory pathway VirB10-like protein